MNETALRNALLAALTANGTIRELCNILSEAIGLPAALALPSRTIVAYSKDYTEELLHEYTDHLLLCTDEECRERISMLETNMKKLGAFEGAYPYMRYKHLTAGCFLQNVLVGVLDCPVTKHIDSRKVIPLLSAAADIFALGLKLENYADVQSIEPMQIFIKSMLWHDSACWYQMHNIHDLPIEQVLSWTLIWSPKLADLWANSRTLQIKSFCKAHLDIWYLEHDGGMVILMNSDRHYSLEEIADLCGKLRPISVSEPFAVIGELKERLFEAKSALALADFEKRTEQIIFVKNYKIPMAYLYLKHNLNYRSLCHPVIQEIKQYDFKHKTEYYPTLKAYLLCRMNYSEMCSRLYVHKNTIIYRMQRMKELFTLDLTDCRIISALYLSLFEDYHGEKEEHQKI